MESDQNAIKDIKDLKPHSLIKKVDLVKFYLPFSKSTLNRLLKRKQFPAPCNFCGRGKFWKAEDVIAWRAGL